MTQEIRKNDIFFWRYTDEQLKRMNDGNNGGTTYWCVSRIAFYNGVSLVDTFWSGSNNHTFLPSEIGEKILVTPVGNFDELEQAPREVRSYYRGEDIVDLRHANNSSLTNVYIRKGAKRDLSVMQKSLQEKIDDSERKARYEKDNAERLKKTLETLNEQNKDEIYI